MTSDARFNLAYPVFARALRSPDRVALVGEGVERTFAQLVDRARRLAGVMSAYGLGEGRRVGILGSRSVVALEAVLAAAWLGVTYVPLGLRWPPARLDAVLARLRLDALVADRSGVALLPMGSAAIPPLVFVPTEATRDQLPSATRARVSSLENLPPALTLDVPAAVRESSLAYILFTSGTTGQPKGVMVTVRSAATYLRALGDRKSMTENDRATQFTELSFDPSIGEIFLPWYAGATLYIVPPITSVSPVQFVRQHAITIWGSAPAAIAWMRNTRALQPGALPSLRYSSFGREPLTQGDAQAWRDAAPNSVVDNLYGPPEATVDCCGQRVEPSTEPVVTPGRGVLAIGRPHSGSELGIMDPAGNRISGSAVGEIAIAGEQLSAGYFDEPDLTALSFQEIDGKRWYLTGDLGMRDEDGCFHHLGRIEHPGS